MKPKKEITVFTTLGKPETFLHKKSTVEYIPKTSHLIVIHRNTDSSQSIFGPYLRFPPRKKTERTV